MGQTVVVYEPDLKKLARHLSAEARAGDLILVMGAGDIYQVAQTVAAELADRRPNILTPTENNMHIQADLNAMLSDKAIIRRDEPMARHTSLRVGGPADVWAEPGSEKDLALLLQYCHVTRRSGDDRRARHQSARARWRHSRGGHPPGKRCLLQS